MTEVETEFQWQSLQDELSGANDEVTTKSIDDTLKVYSELRHEIDVLNAKLKDLTTKKVEAEQKLISQCEATGKTNWQVKGFGTARVMTKKNFKLPKDVNAKNKVFDWLTDEFGIDTLMSYLTINHNSFNKVMRDTIEEKPDFKLEGVEEPFEYKTIRWEKSK